MMNTNEVAQLSDVVVTELTAPVSLRRKPTPDFRTRRPKPDRFGTFWARVTWRLKHDVQFLRSVVQLTFLLLCVWIGIEFYLFVRSGMSGELPFVVNRPPGVEGFLPISALMSLKYWYHTGNINSIHPSGLFIFVAILLISLLMKKAFCSWMCPIGTLSESLWMIGKKLFGRNLQIPRLLDVPLRGVKYLILGFFVVVVASMDSTSLRAFIESPYNKMADVKMYLFFANISSFALWTILVLAALSIVVKNVWCRYLCPYGGLLGILSLLSPLKVTRQVSSCIDCELCTKACPSGLKLHAVKRVWSDECTACYECVDACPVKNTLDVRATMTSKPIPSWVFGTLVVFVFVALTGLAMLTGHWQNGISQAEYLQQFRQLDTPAYEHFSRGNR
jgi:polyferredoxin